MCERWGLVGPRKFWGNFGYQFLRNDFGVNKAMMKWFNKVDISQEVVEILGKTVYLMKSNYKVGR